MPNNAMSAKQTREFGNLITSAGDFLSNHDDLPQRVREIVADFESKARKYNSDLSEGVQDRGRYLDDGPAEKSS
jgi:hypothetical protein